MSIKHWKNGDFKHAILDLVLGADNWRGKMVGDVVIRVPVHGPVSATVEYVAIDRHDVQVDTETKTYRIVATEEPAP